MPPPYSIFDSGSEWEECNKLKASNVTLVAKDEPSSLHPQVVKIGDGVGDWGGVW